MISLADILALNLSLAQNQNVLMVNVQNVFIGPIGEELLIDTEVLYSIVPRKKRLGEYVCHCKAYEFPHRFGGGKCKGMIIVEEHWENSRQNCKTCNCHHSEECEVINGQESIREAECFEEFVELNEIKIYD